MFISDTDSKFPQFSTKMYQRYSYLKKEKKKEFYSTTPRRQPPWTQPAVSSCLWAGPLCLKAGPAFSLAPLPRAESLAVSHTLRPHSAAWPAGTLAMATQIPAGLAVRNRSSLKYERQEALIRRSHWGSELPTQTSRSSEGCIPRFYLLALLRQIATILCLPSAQ